MNIKNILSLTLLSLFLLIGPLEMDAQKKRYIATPVDGFSKGKTSYITLTNGEQFEARIKKMKRKKWLFQEMEFITEDGKKLKYPASEIKSMYLPQSGMDKLGKFTDSMYDVTEWEGSEELNQEHLKEGYAYFESTEVNYKKDKVQTLLLQLLNPAFSSKVKIYHNPASAERGGMRVGGFKVTESVENSYWIKVGDDTAFKIKKKQYDDMAEVIYAECPNYLRKLKKYDWKKFGEDVYNYTKSCGVEE